MVSTMPSTNNPLSGFMRQPKIYIKLPSNGAYWSEGSLNVTDTGEYPVYSMTAKDEILLKIPDALMNGQAVVDVIQNCVPNIVNAWNTPVIDLDVLLIAIRLATYGETMDTPIKIGDLELEYNIDLHVVMDSLMSRITWNPAVPINSDITVFVKPLTYKDLTNVNIQSFETQKIMSVVNDENLSDDDKIKLFQESFKKLSTYTIEAVTKSIDRIDTNQGSTSDPAFISEFINNSDKEIFNTVQKHIEQLNENNKIKPIAVAVTDEMREQGVTGETVEIPLTFDPSTFFV
jgi:hypothetical protein